MAVALSIRVEVVAVCFLFLLFFSSSGALLEVICFQAGIFVGTTPRSGSKTSGFACAVCLWRFGRAKKNISAWDMLI